MNTNVEKITPNGVFTNYIFKAIPLAFDESMSYYECLCGLLNYLKNTVIPTVNNNADAVIEVQNAFLVLKNYVDNYFTNLDVQEEINNKLDEMVEDGTMDALLNTNLTGSLSDLETTDKSNLVNAINEVNSKAGDNTTNITTNTSNIGDLSNLETTNKTNLVSAINELVNNNTSINQNITRNASYSTTETEIGTWINDEPLYRKVIVVDDLTPTDNYLEISHNITNLKTVTSLKTIAYDGLNAYFDFNNFTWYDENLSETTLNSTVHVFVDNTNIMVVYQGTHSINYVTKAYFILEYTKDNLNN